MIKKVLSLVLALVFILPVCAFAAEEDEIHYLHDVPFLGNIEKTEEFLSAFGFGEAEYNRLVDVVTGATMNNEAYVDLTSFGIKTEADMALRTVFAKGDPEAFHLSDLEEVYDESGKYITGMKVWYCRTYDAHMQEVEACRESAAKLLRGIEGNDALTDMQKALLIHDRLTDICAYDKKMTYTYGNSSIYGPLVKGYCTCEGYTRAYRYLLERVGIDGYTCTSAKLVHIWNVVIIDGEEYYVDCTWDDQAYEVSGRVEHKNFLKSYAAFSNHNATDYCTSPSSTKYDGYFWENVKSTFEYLNGKFYYIDCKKKTLIEWDGADSFRTVLEIGGQWHGSKGSRLSDSYTVLDSDGTYLYYTKPDGVYKYDVVSGVPELIFTPDLSVLPYASIFGFRLEENSLRVEIYNSAKFTDAYTRENYTVLVPYESAPTVIPGDVNGDGDVTILDSRNLKKYLMSSSSAYDFVFAGADIDGDGEITLKDSKAIKRLLLGY